MRTEGFKGVLLLTLMVALMMVLAISLLSIDRGSVLFEGLGFQTNTIMFIPVSSTTAGELGHPTPEDAKISIRVDFPAPEFTQVGEYHRVTMSGLQSFGNPGEPILPLSTVRVLIPYEQEVKAVEVTHGRRVILGGSYYLEPAQRTIPLCFEGRVEPTPPDENIYNSPSPFPTKIHSDPFTQSKRGYRILILNLYPVSYVPAERRLSYFEDMTVEVKTELPTAHYYVMESPSLRCSAEDRREITNLVDNPETIDTYPQEPSESIRGESHLDGSQSYQYVIITSESLENYSDTYDWQALCNRKESKGITTNIVTLDWIYSNYDGGDNPEKIRNFIKAAYNDWGTKYVLLGGDDTVVPFRRFWVEAFDPDENEWFTENMPSDMYYSCLDGTFNHDNDGYWGEPNDGEDGGEVDFYAEVYVGRAPVASGADVSNVVRKTLAFENFDPENRYLAYMVGEYLGWGGLMDYAKPSLEEIRLGSDAYGYTTEGFVSCGAVRADTLYEENQSWSGDDLINIVNNGVRVLNHLGHGNPYIAMKLYNSDLDSLTNTEYFFAYSQTCSAGHFDGFECWAEKVVRMENGAAAVVMNARYGFGNADNTDGPSQHFAREFWDAAFGEKKYNLGVMNSDSKEDQDWYISLSSRGRWCAYELNLFGDPELHFIPLPMLHDPIYIDGNAGFTPENGVNGGGDGTEGNPYIIENYIIDASPIPFALEGIGIGNTTAYFVVRNCVVENGGEYYNGICLNNVRNGKVENCTYENNRYGIVLNSSYNNTISNNTCENNDEYGIVLWYSDNNRISNNLVENNNEFGIYLSGSDNNHVYHNNFVNNSTHAYDDGTNYWDGGYPSGGNYWDNYTGVDENKGENQDIPGGDGIGDTPYYIPGDNNRDRYPLMNPWPTAAWWPIETWTGTVEAPVEWQLIEAWTGTVRAPSLWRLIEAWTGAIEAPAQWQPIETWTGTIRTQAPAEWQLIETWEGAVESPAQWHLVERWTGTIEVPFAWKLIETWSGTIEALATWQLVETWTGTVEALAVWQLIETWTGTIEALAAWQLVETWTGTIEAPTPPGKPVLVLPENATRTDNMPTFVWIIGSNADNHRLLVDNDSDFSSPEENVLLGAVDNQHTAELVDENYYWKVIAINSVGENGSATWTLLIDTAPPTISGVTAENITQSSGTITWTTDEPSNSVVEYGTTTSYGSTIFDATLVTNHPITLTGLSAGTTYHYRVKSTNALGNTATSSDYAFTTSSPPPPPAEADDVPPPVPSLISPADDENITDNTPSLDWSGVSDPSGVTYDLTIAGDAGFTSIVLQKTNLTASAYELTSAEALAVGTYYWHVCGVDGVGNVGSWSENWSFTYTEIPTGLIENESPPIDIPSITTDENATIEVENTAITGMTIDVGENVENVRITVQQLTDKPAEIAIGAPGVTYTYLNIVSENITDADIDIVLINFEVENVWITAEDIDPDSIVMLRWDSVAEVWVSLPTTRIGEDDTYYCYQAESPGLSIFGIGYALTPAPAEFEFSNLVIEPSEVRAGKTVTISVVVAHVGDLGSYNVILKIDNVVEAAESVTLAGVATETVTFTVSSDAEGTHDVEVEGLAGTFVVTPSAPPSIVPLTITGGIVLLAGILIWLRRRRTPVAGGYPSTNGAS